MDVCRYVFTYLCIQYLWRDSHETGNTSWVAEKGRRRGGRAGAVSRELVVGRGVGGYLISSLANQVSNQL